MPEKPLTLTGGGTMVLSQHVESYRFWDVVNLWAEERLEHEHVVARALARGVVRDGLRMQSVEDRWLSAGTFELRGAPLVGYVARQGGLPIFIRASALAHMRDIVERAATPDRQQMLEEFVTKQDFLTWLARFKLPVPSFWFAPAKP
jgi:hypothetical protein